MDCFCRGIIGFEGKYTGWLQEATDFDFEFKLIVN